MITNAIRNFVALVLWLLLAIVSLYMNVQVTIANYLGSKAALELQGYESQPLYTDSLVGRLLGSLFADATLAQFFALGVAIVQALGLFFLFNIAFGLSKLFEIRKENLVPIIDSDARGVSDEVDRAAEVRAANHRIVLSFIKIGCLLFLLYWAISWDLELFRFRSVADALANGSPEVNPMQVPSWVNFATANDHLFVKHLIGIGAWGYLAITALGCFLLEVSFENVSERWARLMAPVDNAIANWLAPATVGQEIFYGYDLDGRPVYEPQTPIAYDTDGKRIQTDPITPTEESVVDDEQTDVSATSNSVLGEQTSVVDVAGHHAQASAASRDEGTPLFDISSAETRAANDAVLHAVPDGPATADSQLRDVIGASDERISLAVAQANPDRYYVDKMNGEIWSRTHWERLHEEPVEPEAKAA